MNTADQSSARDPGWLLPGSYRAIFDASEDSIAIHDFDTGKVLDVNPKACESSGYSRAELLGLTVMGLGSGIAPSTEAAAQRYLAQARCGERPSFEWQRRNKDGSLHWGAVRLKAVEIGGKRYILAFRHDITEQKAMLEALQLREEQYRVIFEAASDGFVLRDGQLRTIDANPAFYRMYGFDRAYIMGGGGYPEGFPRDYVEARDAQLRLALLGVPTHTESIAYRADGSSFWIDLRVIPVRYRGEPHVLQVVHDISARRESELQREKLEAQLRQAQKMELIGQLTGSIAHDFNNILTSVMGYIVLATERAEPLGDDKLVRQLGRAHLAAQRACDLIARMLTFARRSSSEREAIALAPLVEQSLSLLRSTLPSTVRVELDVAPQLSAVAADAVQIEQIVFNLCINARDAMHGSGRLRVSLREKALQGECAACRSAIDGHWIELAVGDDGSGIAPDVMARMFDPFFTTKEVGRGSGMGLAMVNGIVHDHGGHVLVESRLVESRRLESRLAEPGPVERRSVARRSAAKPPSLEAPGDAPRHGSVFRVLLPPATRAARTGPSPTAPASAAVPSMRGSLLLVEDEPSVGEYMLELLEGWGLQVVLCRDPVDALECFAADPAAFDLVVTDLVMPAMTGTALIARLQALRPGLPAVLYTGNGQGLDEALWLRSGVAAVLYKPVDRDLLSATLRRLLGD